MRLIFRLKEKIMNSKCEMASYDIVENPLWVAVMLKIGTWKLVLI